MTKTVVSVQNGKPLEVAKSRTNRNRPRLNITISKDNLEWLRKNVSNISKFIDRLVESAKSGIEPAFVVISPVSLAGVAELGKGAGLKTLSRRGPRVQIPPPALILESDAS